MPSLKDLQLALKNEDRDLEIMLDSKMQVSAYHIPSAVPSREICEVRKEKEIKPFINFKEPNFLLGSLISHPMPFHPQMVKNDLLLIRQTLNTVYHSAYYFSQQLSVHKDQAFLTYLKFEDKISDIDDKVYELLHSNILNTLKKRLSRVGIINSIKKLTFAQ
jgi:hypothetical protein